MEPEGIETPLQESQLKGPGQNTIRSQCRGRGFESLHLHQKPSSEGQGRIPQKITFSDVSLRVFDRSHEDQVGTVPRPIRFCFLFDH